jgi:hypothetical protein
MALRASLSNFAPRNHSQNHCPNVQAGRQARKSPGMLTCTPGSPPIHALVARDPDIAARRLNRASAARTRTRERQLGMLNNTNVLRDTRPYESSTSNQKEGCILELKSTQLLQKRMLYKSDMQMDYHMSLTLRNDCNIRSLHAREYSAFHRSIRFHAFVSFQMIRRQVKNHRHLTRYPTHVALSYIRV